jgi:hypothetical protein
MVWRLPDWTKPSDNKKGSPKQKRVTYGAIGQFSEIHMIQIKIAKIDVNSVSPETLFTMAFLNTCSEYSTCY